MTQDDYRELYAQMDSLADTFMEIAENSCTCGNRDCVFVSDHADDCGYRLFVEPV